MLLVQTADSKRDRTELVILTAAVVERLPAIAEPLEIDLSNRRSSRDEPPAANARNRRDRATRGLVRTAAKTIADPIRFLAYAMTCGDDADMRIIRRHLTDEELREAME